MFRKIFEPYSQNLFVVILLVLSIPIHCEESEESEESEETEEIETSSIPSTTTSEPTTVASKKNETVIPKEVAESVLKYMEQCSADFRQNLTSMETTYISKNTQNYEDILTELLEVDWKEEQQRRLLGKQMAKEKEKEKLMKEKGKKPGTLKPSKKNKDKPQTTPTPKVNKMDKFEEVDFKQKRTKAYFKNRSSQWKLFFRWLAKTKGTSSGTKGRLKEFFEVYDSAINCGLTEDIFVDCVSHAWVNPSNITKLPPEIDVKKMYNSFVGITSKHEIETPCADLMSKIYNDWPASKNEASKKSVE